MKKASLFAVSAIVSTLLTGCGSVSRTAVTPQITGFGGRVHGGINPVVGATVQLWQVGSTGYGSAPTALGSSVLTDSNGGFYLGASGIVCPVSNPAVETYLTATGGNPGYPSATNNDGLYLMTAVGSCNKINASSFWSVNEVSTVASVYALAQFIDPATGNIGGYGNSSSNYNTTGLTNAFNLAVSMYNIATGTAYTTTPYGNGVVPQQEINTLANIITPCANDTSHTGVSCSALISAVHTQTPPVTNTLTAALAIATHPGYDVSGIYSLALANPAFQPALPGVTPPNDFTVALSFHSGALVPASLAIDATGNVWIADYATGGSTSSLIELGPQGIPAPGSPFTSNTNDIAYLAIDTKGYVWTEGPNTATLTAFNPGGGLATTTNVGAASALAIDSANNPWTANGSNGLNVYSNVFGAEAGTYTGGGLNTPYAIAFDASGNAWAANHAGTGVSEFTPGGVPVNPTATSLAGASLPDAIAIDNAGDVWLGNGSGNDISELFSGGATTEGYTGSGMGNTAAIAVDGASVIWSAGTNNELAAVSHGGTTYSPANGFQATALNNPSGIGIDQSGNVWVTNKTHTTINSKVVNTVAFVGLATPAITPVAAAVQNNQIGQAAGTPIPVVVPPDALPYYTTSSPYTANLIATGGNSGSYTWSFVSGSLPTGMSLATNGVLSGTPSTSTPTTFTAQAADTGLPTNLATQTFTLTPTTGLPAGSNTSNLAGQYVVLFNGFKGGSAPTGGAVTGWAALGSLAFDGSGNVTGYMDYNGPSGHSEWAPTGSYTVGPDGRGMLLLSGGPAGLLPQQFAFAVSNGYFSINFTEFDYTGSGTATGMATGIGKRQTPGDFNAGTLGQTFVFGVQGETPCSTCSGTVTPYGPVSAAGRLVMSGGTLTGQEDAAGMQTGYTGITLAGSYTAPGTTYGDGVITAAPTGTTFPAPPQNFNYYIVNFNEIMFISYDGHDTHSLLSGDALLQTQTFSSTPANNNSLLSGPYIVTQAAVAGANYSASSYPYATDNYIVNANFDGAGNATIIQDENAGGIVALDHNVGTLPYSIDGTGRMTFSGGPLGVYFASPYFAFGTQNKSGNNPGAFTVIKQTATSVSCSTLTGPYSFGSPAPPTVFSNSSGVLTVSGTTSTVTLDNSDTTGVLTYGGSETDNCTTDANTTALGRLLFTNPASGDTAIVYVVSPGYLVYLNTTPNKVKTAITILQSQ